MKEDSKNLFMQSNPHPFATKNLYRTRLFLVFEGSFLELFGSIGSSVLLLFQFSIGGNMSFNASVLESRFLSIISSSIVISWCFGCILLFKSVDFFLSFLDVLKGD